VDEAWVVVREGGTVGGTDVWSGFGGGLWVVVHIGKDVTQDMRLLPNIPEPAANHTRPDNHLLQRCWYPALTP